MVLLGLAVRSAARLWANVAKPSFFQQMLSCVGALPLNLLFRLIFLDSSLASSMTILLTYEMLRMMGCLRMMWCLGEDVGFKSSQTFHRGTIALRPKDAAAPCPASSILRATASVYSSILFKPVLISSSEAS